MTIQVPWPSFEKQLINVLGNPDKTKWKKNILKIAVFVYNHWLAGWLAFHLLKQLAFERRILMTGLCVCWRRNRIPIWLCQKAADHIVLYLLKIRKVATKKLTA